MKLYILKHIESFLKLFRQLCSEAYEYTNTKQP